MLPRIDLYQIHWRVPLLSDRAWLVDLAQAVDQGLVGAVGVSNYDARHLRRAHRVLGDLGVPLATNQVRYNLLERGPERSGLAETCQELQVRIIAYSPLAQGLLTGKYRRGHLPGGLRGLSARRHLARMPELIGRLQRIGQAHGGKSAAQVALNWLVRKGALPIPGAKTAEQARHNAGAAGWELTAAEVAALDGGRDA